MKNIIILMSIVTFIFIIILIIQNLLEKRRLEIYEEKTSPLVEYYKNKGVLRTETVSLSINRMGKDVADDIVKDIKGM